MEDIKTTGADANGIYKGFVINNSDPSRKGRVQVRVPAFHGFPGKTPLSIPDVDLPWATPACMLGIGVQNGMWCLPPVNSVVYIMFEDGDISYPVYFGTVPVYKTSYVVDNQDVGSIVEPELVENPDYRIVYISRSGEALVERLSDGLLGFYYNQVFHPLSELFES